MNTMRIGLDLAKNVFEVYAVDGNETFLFRKMLKRQKLLTFCCRLEPSIVGMESCGGVHYWSRKLRKLVGMVIPLKV